MEEVVRRFTPGPWRVVSTGLHVVSDSGPGNVFILRTGLPRVVDDLPRETIERWEADARLVAAAPEMLEALEALDLSCTTNLLNPCWDNRPGDIPGKHWGEGNACAHCNARAAIAKALGELIQGAE